MLLSAVVYYNAVYCSAVRIELCNEMQCSSMQCRTVHFSAVPCSAARYTLQGKHYPNCAHCCVSVFTTVSYRCSVHVFSANRGSGGETQTTHLATHSLPPVLSLGWTFCYRAHTTLSDRNMELNIFPRFCKKI